MRKQRSVIAPALVCAAFAVVVWAGESEFASHIAAARHAMEKGDYSAAIKSFSAAVREARGWGEDDERFAKAQSGVTEAYMGLAAEHVRHQRYQEAMGIYRSAIGYYDKRDPRHPELLPSLVGLADIYVVQQRFFDAQKLYERAAQILERLLPKSAEQLTEVRRKMAASAREAMAAGQDVTQGKTAYRRGDFALAFELLRTASDERRSDAESRFMVGEMYLQGKGVAKDGLEAMKWFLRAADLQWPAAHEYVARFRLGLAALQLPPKRLTSQNADLKRVTEIAEHGDPHGLATLAYGLLAIDPAEGARWMHIAANQGHPFAQRYLGELYMRGTGVERDGQKALRWLSRAGAQGNAFALLMLYAPQFVRSDAAASSKEEVGAAIRSSLEKQAEAGEPNAQLTIGKLMMSGVTFEIVMGRGEKASYPGFAKDPVRGMHWIRKAAEQGLPDAQFALAEIYLEGQVAPRDETQAKQWLQHAAAKDQADAAMRLRELEWRDSNRARHWLEKAAGLEHPAAQLEIGQALFDKRDVEALVWLRKAAMYGQPKAHRLLSQAFAEGRGVKQDAERAKKWAASAENAEIWAGTRRRLVSEDWVRMFGGL